IPYGPRPNRTANIHITVRRDLPTPERSGGTSRDGGRRDWFKITIPYGKKYDKSWLLSSIQNLCSVPFTPVEFHYDHNRAQFYVEDATTASALKQVSRKITDRDNYKVVIIINSSAPPQSLQNELKPEEIEQLKLCMSKRYDGSQRALDLKSLRVDPDLVSQSIDVVLNQRSCMLVVLRIIEDNIPELQSLNLSSNKLYRLDDLSELAQKAAGLKILDLSRNELKSDRELDKVKGLKLEELWLDGNPLCDAFRDQSTYIRSVLALGRPEGPVGHPCSDGGQHVDGKSRDSVRAFTRMFIAVPAGNTGLCIVNDELFVRNATTEEIRKAFLMPAPTPSSSPVPTLSAAAGVLFPLRAVRRVTLLRGGAEVSISTHAPFGLGSGPTFTVPLRHVSCRAHRSEVPAALPLKVKGRPFFFLLDKRGQLCNPRLFDLTVGAYRNL
ncbi:PREDICTED: nuclear RNA export factor 1-like, partial [Charadrius vociferus]|uniref:nuclear RNA export factor 1-like n=1 Tax=Charadrius vociferus TaxID=50402 RepID=UPI000521AC9E